MLLLRMLSSWERQGRVRLSIYVAALLVGAIALPGHAEDGARDPAPVVRVERGRVDAEIAPISHALTEWMRYRLAQAGARMSEPNPGAKTLATKAEPLPGQATETAASIERAAESGATHVLLVDLRSERGRVEADLRLYEVGTRRLVGGGLVDAAARRLVYESEDALATVAGRLGLELVPASPPHLRALSVGKLAALSRAIDALERGRLAKAWREVGKDDHPLARSIAKQIDRASGAKAVPVTTLAQLDLAKGRSEAAWQKLEPTLAAKGAGKRPSAETLVVAGEVKLSMGGVREARGYFDEALAQEPANVAATLGVARVLSVERKHEEARKTFERAARLDLDAPEALELAADTASDDPALRAQYLLKAADRRADRLDTDIAQAHLAEAVQLEPSTEPGAARAAAELHVVEGDYDEALVQYGRAREVGRESASLLVDEARTQRAAGMTLEAASTLETVITDHDPQHDEALLELGGLYVEEGRAAEAVPLLETARQVEPESSPVERTLASALALRNAQGDKVRALDLIAGSDGTDVEWTSGELREMAALQAETGDLEGAAKTLERALTVRELDVAVQRDIVEVMKAQGDENAAGAWSSRFSHSGLNDYLEPDVGLLAQRSRVPVEELDRIGKLVDSFEVEQGVVMQVVLQGIREPMEPKEFVLDWLMPRTTNMPLVVDTLRQSLEAVYVVKPATELGANFQREVEQLFDFGSSASLSVRTITDLNIAHEADAVFLGTLARMPGDSAAPVASCWAKDHYRLEVRRLSGQTESDARVHSNQACLAGGVEGVYGDWNRKAAAVYGSLFLLVFFPFLRGWGRLQVDFHLPEGAQAMFAVSLTKRPSKVRDRSDKTKASATSTFRNQLRRVGRSERRLQGTRMLYRMVPARRGPYYLAIRGPLVDLASNQLIGEFLEERTLQITRGQLTRFDFDLRTREAMVTVVVKRGSESIEKARIAVRGRPATARFCHEGKGVLYLPEGEHIVVAGCGDRVAEQPVEIQGMAPVTLAFDLAVDWLFDDCPKAVEAYVEGNFTAAAHALDAAGQNAAAHDIGALANVPAPAASAAPQPMPLEETAVTFEAREPEPEVTRSPEAWAQVAAQHEEADETHQAAEAYREAGDLINAARCFEDAYDWNNAIECFQDLGDMEKVMSLMETAGEVYDAGMLAMEYHQFDRAIYNLQQVDSRHPRYSECCRTLAELFCDRGEHDLAIEKFDEGMQLAGSSEVPLDLLARYADMLDEAGRSDDALEVWTSIRRRDVHFEGVNTKIEALKKQLNQATVEPGSDNAATVVASRAAAQPVEQTRYEIQGELGRGGMGVVYRALDTHLQRVVALKVLSENLREHETALELFLREARSAAALNHRNIVTVYDAGQEGSMDFISMECLEGSGVDAILKQQGALNPRTVASIGLQVASGLDYAQKHKIIHRDIKPSNLFITTDRVVKIMDFGLAKMVEEVRRSTTIIGGTPNYMAPEQAVGEATNHRADLYALGGTLFHLLTGSVPYESGDVTYQHAHSPVPDPREREMTVPPELAELVMRLMQKAPDDRYQTAREVAVALQAYLKASA